MVDKDGSGHLRLLSLFVLFTLCIMRTIRRFALWISKVLSRIFLLWEAKIGNLLKKLTNLSRNQKKISEIEVKNEMLRELIN